MTQALVRRRWLNAAGTAWKRSGKSDIVPTDVSFIFGTTKPVPTGTWGTRNVGPSFNYDQTTRSTGGPSGGWTYVNGDYAITTPGEYKNLWIEGTMRISADNVWVHDCVIRGRADRVVAPANQNYGIYIQTGRKSIVIEYCDIGVDVANQSYVQSTGVRADGFTLRRSYIWGWVDGIMPYGSSTGARQAFIYGNWIETGQHFAYDGGNHPDGTHNDAIQSEGFTGLEIIGNVLMQGYTSCLLATNNVPGGYSLLRVTDNWCYGNAIGGSQINLAGSNMNPVVLRNRFDRVNSLHILISVTNKIAANFGMSGTTGANVNTWTIDGTGNHNIFEDTGLPVNLTNG